ncbi:hypothetical protein [Helicobacter sp.]|nr:hypothetical protein [Helicobacter sp.]
MRENIFIRHGFYKLLVAPKKQNLITLTRNNKPKQILALGVKLAG